MSEVYKYRIKLETLSALALSPRAQSGIYQKEVIYPFYQYGTYQKYAPEQTQYYIPGSSIKGAMATDCIRGFLVDDIRVASKDLELRTLRKVQHIPEVGSASDNRRAMKIEDFFPNIKMEILKSGVIYSGNFVFPQNPTEILKRTKEQTEERVNQMVDWLERILMTEPVSEMNNGYDTEEKCRMELCEMKSNLEVLLEESKTIHKDEFLLLLGGYKGLILSGVYNAKKTSSIYIDEDRKLPYGIVRIGLEYDE